MWWTYPVVLPSAALWNIDISWGCIKHYKSIFYYVLNKKSVMNTLNFVIPVSTTVLNKTNIVPVPKLARVKQMPPQPPAFDARDKWQGCLSTPTTQGTCGSCWAFASVTTLQDRFCIASCAPATSVWADLDSVHLCSNNPHTFNAKNENQLYNIADQLFALKKVTIRLLFFQVKTGYGKVVPEALWSSTKPCDQVSDILPQISMAEWIAYFTQAYNQLKNGTTSKQRTQGLTNIALMEMGAPLGFYLPLSERDTLPVAQQKMKLYFKFWDTNNNNKIDLCEFEKVKESGPMQLSIQKVIVCLITNETLPSVQRNIAEGPIQANAACGGASLTEAWRYLRDSGTPVESCVGYTFQNWGSEPTDSSLKQTQDVLPMCKELLGPDRNQCPGFVPQHEWNTLVDLIVTGKEKLEQERLGSQQQTKELKTFSSQLLGMEPWDQPLLVMFRALNAYSVAPEVEQIQLEIHQNGPVSTGFTVYEDFITSYGATGRGGQKFDGKSVLGSTETSLIYKWDGESQSTGTAHAVVIIGWGVFKNIPFWLVRNSWGTEWGTSGDFHGFNGQPTQLRGGGYFWFHRGSNDCGLEANVVAGLPDLAGDAFPGTIVQPSESRNLANVSDLKPGYNCVYQKNGLVCHTLGFHGSSADYEEIDEKIVPIDVTSPLAFFWPNTPEANNKRKALYNEIQSYIHKSNLLTTVQKEFDTLFASNPDSVISLLEQKGASVAQSDNSKEFQLFIGLLVSVIFSAVLIIVFWVVRKVHK